MKKGGKKEKNALKMHLFMNSPSPPQLYIRGKKNNLKGGAGDQNAQYIPPQICTRLLGYTV